MLSAFRSLSFGTTKQLVVEPEEKKSCLEKKADKPNTQISLLQQLKNDALVRAIFFNDIPGVWREIETILISSTTTLQEKAQEIVATYADLCDRQKNMALAELMNLLTRKFHTFNEQQPLVLLACIVHNTENLFRVLLDNIRKVELSEQTIFQLYYAAVFFERDIFCQEMRAAHLILPPILLTIAYQLGSSFLTTLWDLMDPENKKIAFFSLLRVLNARATTKLYLPAAIRRFQQRLTLEDYIESKELPLPKIPVLRVFHSSQLTQLNQYAKEGNYSLIFAEIEAFQAAQKKTNSFNQMTSSQIKNLILNRFPNLENKSLLNPIHDAQKKALSFFSHKIKEYLAKTSQPKLADIEAIGAFYQAIFADTLNLLSEIMPYFPATLKTETLYFYRFWLQHEKSCYNLPILWMTRLLLERKKLSLPRYRMLHFFSNAKTGFNKAICQGNYLYQHEVLPLVHYLESIMPNPLWGLAQLNVSLKKDSTAQVMPLPLPIELQQIVVSFLETAQQIALFEVYPSLKILTMVSKQTQFLQKQLLTIDYLIDELAALTTHNRWSWRSYINMHTLFGFGMVGNGFVCFYYFFLLLANLILTPNESMINFLTKEITASCSPNYKLFLNVQMCYQIVTTILPDCEVLCDKLRILVMPIHAAELNFIFTLLLTPLLAGVLVAFTPQNANRHPIPVSSTRKIITLFQNLDVPAPTRDIQNNYTANIIDQLHKNKKTINTELQELTEQKLSFSAGRF